MLHLNKISVVINVVIRRQEKIFLKFILNLNMKEYVLPVTNVGIRR